MGDSLIGRTAGFDPVSPGSSPGPPAKIWKACIIIKYLVSFLFILSSLSQSSEKDIEKKLLIKELKKWNIDYDSLEAHKAGAACITKDKDNKVKALGFSFNMFDSNTSKKVALEGCEKMKKNKKIFFDCDCEIIIIDNYRSVNWVK